MIFLRGAATVQALLLKAGWTVDWDEREAIPEGSCTVGEMVLPILPSYAQMAGGIVVTEAMRAAEEGE